MLTVGGTILAQVPSALADMVASGSAQRIGMTIREVGTGKILGHLQETQATQNLISDALNLGGSGLASGPLAPFGMAAGLGQIWQNEQIKGKLDTLQTMMGGLQTLQIATLATSVAGIGVTVASTAVILSRLKKIDARITELAEHVSLQREILEDWDVRQFMSDAETQLERLSEADYAARPEQVMEAVEARIHEIHGRLHLAALNYVVRDHFDAQMLMQIISSLSLCSSAQLRVLIWLNEPARASVRAGSQLRRLTELAMRMPQDVVAERAGSDVKEIRDLDAYLGEIRCRLASVPGLLGSLEDSGMNGRAYLEQAQHEDVEPFLFVRAA